MGYDIASLVPAFCSAFLGQTNFEEGGIVVWDQIDLSAYDYSVASLEQVDRYLDAIRDVKDQLEWQAYTNTVLATGSYIGEVLRQHGDDQWEWINFATFSAQFPQVKSAMGILKEDLNCAAVLASKGRRVILPFNKVIRNLEEGAENNIHFYITALGAGD